MVLDINPFMYHQVKRSRTNSDNFPIQHWLTGFINEI